MIVGMSLESFIGTSSKFLAEPSGSRCSPCGRIAGHRQPFHAGRTWRCETNADGPDGVGRRHRPDRAQPAAHPLAQRRAAAYRLRGRGRGGLTARTTRVTVETIWMARKRMFFSSEKAVCELGYRWRAPAKAFEDAVLWLREQELL